MRRPGEKGRPVRKRLSLALMTGCLAVCLTGCQLSWQQIGERLSGLGESGEQQDQPAGQVRELEVGGNPFTVEQTVALGRKDIKRREISSGSITPYIEELSFQDSGIFLEYRVSVGAKVRAGQVLALTDTEAYEDQAKELQEQIGELEENYNYQLKSLKNELEKQEVWLEHLYGLLEDAAYGTWEYTDLCVQAGNTDGEIKRKELEIRQLTETYEKELPYLEANLARCRSKIGQNVIVAPFAGVILELRSVENGARINESSPYIVIGDTSRYYAVGDYMRDYNVKKAERIYVFMNGREYDAQYIPLDDDVYSKLAQMGETLYSAYRIDTEEELPFGHTALVVVQYESRENVLAVPETAVRKDGSRYYCYRQKGDQKEKVYIETGLYDGIYYEVLGGLEEGDVVYIE